MHVQWASSGAFLVAMVMIAASPSFARGSGEFGGFHGGFRGGLHDGFHGFHRGFRGGFRERFFVGPPFFGYGNAYPYSPYAYPYPVPYSPYPYGYSG